MVFITGALGLKAMTKLVVVVSREKDEHLKKIVEVVKERCNKVSPILQKSRKNMRIVLVDTVEEGPKALEDDMIIIARIRLERHDNKRLNLLVYNIRSEKFKECGERYVYVDLSKKYKPQSDESYKLLDTIGNEVFLEMIKPMYSRFMTDNTPKDPKKFVSGVAKGMKKILKKCKKKYKEFGRSGSRPKKGKKGKMTLRKEKAWERVEEADTEDGTGGRESELNAEIREVADEIRRLERERKSLERRRMVGR